MQPLRCSSGFRSYCMCCYQTWVIASVATLSLGGYAALGLSCGNEWFRPSLAAPRVTLCGTASRNPRNPFLVREGLFPLSWPSLGADGGPIIWPLPCATDSSHTPNPRLRLDDPTRSRRKTIDRVFTSVVCMLVPVHRHDSHVLNRSTHARGRTYILRVAMLSRRSRENMLATNRHEVQ